MKKHRKNATIDLQHYQEWVDYDMKHYHKISDKTMNDIRKAGLTITKDQYGDYEVTAACKPSRKTVKADTVKKGNKWVNRGDTGKEHGDFDTKKKADAQRKAMYANGYKGKVTASDYLEDVGTDVKGIISYRLELICEDLGIAFDSLDNHIDSIYNDVIKYLQ